MTAHETIKQVARWLAWDARKYSTKALPVVLREEVDADNGGLLLFFSNRRVARVRSPLGVRYYARKTADPLLIVKARYEGKNAVRFVIERTGGNGKRAVVRNVVYRGYEFRR